MADLRNEIKRNPSSFVPPNFGFKYKLPYRLVGSSKEDTIKNLLSHQIYYKGHAMSIGELIITKYPSNDVKSARSPRGCKRRSSPQKRNNPGKLSISIPADGVDIEIRHQGDGTAQPLVSNTPFNIKVSMDGESAAFEIAGYRQRVQRVTFDRQRNLLSGWDDSFVYLIHLKPEYVADAISVIRRYKNYQALTGQ